MHIGILVQALWVLHVAGEGVEADEATACWVVGAGSEVLHPQAGVPLLAGVAEVALDRGFAGAGKGGVCGVNGEHLTVGGYGEVRRTAPASQVNVTKCCNDICDSSVPSCQRTGRSPHLCGAI